MKKIVINLILALSIIFMVSVVYAEEAQLKATIEISTNILEVSVGDQVTFAFITRNIENAVDNGKIYAIGGKMTYDTNFFEVASTNGITLGSTGLFNSTNAVTEGGTNGTITLKVKEGATGSTTVIFTDLTASDGRIEDMETLGTAKTEEQSFTIELKKAQEPEVPTEDPNKGEEEKTENVIPDQNKNEVKNDKKDNTATGGKKLPQTGIGLGLSIALIILITMCAFAYVKYGKFKDIK